MSKTEWRIASGYTGMFYLGNQSATTLEFVYAGWVIINIKTERFKVNTDGPNDRQLRTGVRLSEAWKLALSDWAPADSGPVEGKRHGFCAWRRIHWSIRRWSMEC